MAYDQALLEPTEALRMALKITKEDVWAGEMPDAPGGLARLLDALAGAGASVECVIGRRQPDKPGKGVLFVSPVKGKKAQAAAKSAGMSPAAHIGTLRVEGNDKPGLGAKLSRAIAGAGINVRGVSAAVIGNKFVAYFGFDGAGDATKAAKAMKSVDK
jgi:hypothetical protein